MQQQRRTVGRWSSEMYRMPVLQDNGDWDGVETSIHKVGREDSGAGVTCLAVAAAEKSCWRRESEGTDRILRTPPESSFFLS